MLFVNKNTGFPLNYYLFLYTPKTYKDSQILSTLLRELSSSPRSTPPRAQSPKSQAPSLYSSAHQTPKTSSSLAPLPRVPNPQNLKLHLSYSHSRPIPNPSSSRQKITLQMFLPDFSSPLSMIL